MADFDWDAHPEADVADAGSPGAAFSWDDHPEAPAPMAAKPSMLDSAGRGVAQGALFNFADEIAGAGNKVGSYLAKLAAGNDLNDASKAQYDKNVLAKSYDQGRDQYRAQDAAAKEANPGSFLAGEVAGGLSSAPFLPGVSGLGGAVATGAGLGATYGVGGSEADNIGGLARDATLGSVGGALGGAVGHGVGSLIGSGVSNKLSDVAENLALKATGATGRQSQKFAPGAGRELLDRGLVRFADSPANIADRVGEAYEQSGKSIGSALRELDAKGTNASVDNVIEGLQNKIKDLNRVPGNERTISQIQNTIDNLQARGQSELPVSIAEQAKRNYQSDVNYNSPVYEQKGATHAADSFRGEVERAATEADPAIAKRFIEDKKLYGLLDPIKEAAEKRAATLRQSPLGGLGDYAAAAVTPGGAPSKLVGVAAKKVLFPRVASSGAVTADYLAQLTSKSPQSLGKFANVFTQAVERGPQAVAATHFILEQTNPEYREHMKQLNEDESR